MPKQETHWVRTEAFELDVDSRLAAALSEYERAKESGKPIAIEELIGRYQDIEMQLRDCLVAMMYVDAAVTPNIPKPAVVPTLSQGSVVGDFRIIREIGRGGMGVVYEAQQCSVKRSVALKVLPPFGSEHAPSVRRFHNEVQAIGMLQHAHIVPVYAVGEYEGVHYYAMQLISGASLSVLLDQKNRDHVDNGLLSTNSERKKETDATANNKVTGFHVHLGKREELYDSNGDLSLWSRVTSLGKMAELIRDVADALQHAHDFGIVHRDIKPSNLLLDRKGKLWVADFGLAKLPGSELTATNDLIGTLRYMSPEQVAGRSVDGRSDVYSLGVTFYELITGSPAFVAEDRRALLRKVMEEEPVLPRRRRNGIPRDLETICRKSIAKDPSERYQSAGEFRDDLQRFLRDEPIVARRATWMEQSVRWCRRYPVVTGLLAALLIAVSCLAVLSSRLVSANSNLQVAVDRAADARRQLFKALDSVISGGAEDHLSSQKEISPRQREFYETIVRQFKILADSAPMDDNAQLEVSAALTALGGLKNRIGDVNDAETILQDAITRQSSVQKRRPFDAAVIAGLAKSYWTLGHCLEQKDEWEKAAEAFESAVTLLEPLLQQYPDRLSDQRVFASALISIGVTRQNSGDVGAGMATFQSGLSALEAILAQAPHDPWARYSQADCLHLIGRVLADRGDYAESKITYERGLESIAPLIAGPETELHFRTIAAKLHVSRALSIREIDSSHLAIDELTIGIDGLRQIISQSAGNHSVRRQLGLAILRAGQWFHSAGEYEKAIERFTEAEETFQRLVADQPDRPNHRHNVAWVYEERSRTLVESGRYAAARDDLLECLKIWEPLSAENGRSNPWYALGVADAATGLLRLPYEHCVYCTDDQREAAAGKVVDHLKRAYAAGWRPSAKTLREYDASEKWEAFRSRDDFVAYLAMIEK